jgi:hypothetical protein
VILALWGSSGARGVAWAAWRNAPRAVGDRLGGRLDFARLRAVLDGDPVDLERSPALAGAAEVLARVEASGEADHLPAG